MVCRGCTFLKFKHRPPERRSYTSKEASQIRMPPPSLRPQIHHSVPFEEWVPYTSETYVPSDIISSAHYNQYHISPELQERFPCGTGTCTYSTYYATDLPRHRRNCPAHQLLNAASNSSLLCWTKSALNDPDSSHTMPLSNDSLMKVYSILF